MIPYTFSVLRYIHDGVTGEFVNIGVAVYSSDATWLKAKCTTQYGRITKVFDRIDGDRFRQLVRHIDEAVAKLGTRIRQGALSFADPGSSIDVLLRNVLPPDDSAIQFSPAGFGVSANLETTLAELFERYVGRYAGAPDSPSRSDDEVWRVFRQALEKRHVLQRLVPKRIEAPNYAYDFRLAWRNQQWHVYEPISFDLVDAGSLVDKANRWLGRSASLADSHEPFQMHLLLGAPQEARLLPAFEKAKNILRKMPNGPELVLEGEEEVFAAELEIELDRHDGKVHNLF